MEIVVFNEDNFLQLVFSSFPHPSFFPLLPSSSIIAQPERFLRARKFPKFSEPCRFRGVRITIWYKESLGIPPPSWRTNPPSSGVVSAIKITRRLDSKSFRSQYFPTDLFNLSAYNGKK